MEPMLFLFIVGALCLPISLISVFWGMRRSSDTMVYGGIAIFVAGTFLIYYVDGVVNP